MHTYNHKIGEQFTLVFPGEDTVYLRILRAVDGRYFNFKNHSFEIITSESDKLTFCEIEMGVHPSNTFLRSQLVDFLPRIPLDLIFEFRDSSGSVVGYERHTFGGYHDRTRPGLCIIFGTLFDPSGRPLAGARVDASLNKSGYYIDKHPTIGPVASAITNDNGYFELPLVQGINVTVHIPSTGFTTRGYVPKHDALELSGYCLLSESNA